MLTIILSCYISLTYLIKIVLNFNESTRDINNLNVFKCIKSGVIVLEKFMTSEEYYESHSI
jgi:hypothetical protein